ncbi:signal transduction histidine kinase [Ulvibacter antarcticus]|uniref:histidine kinase n=1 Tax=Ulvibacter antarcticus TaxID=442714 RepID=A0A3L9YV76_9FLAO|nr:signal transduction histidine kinase [Ulvibacter antarcticus]
MFSQNQKQFSFSQLSVNDGLSQNSVVSIAQDSTGYLWFATQDGLNKYNGNEFKYYPKLFEDITKENYSKLGKIYIDRKNEIYLITKDKILEKYDPKIDSFRSIPKFKDPSVIYQDSQFTNWVGTYGNGLYRSSERDTLQLLQGSDIIKGIFAISEYNDKLTIAASGALFEMDKDDFSYKSITLSTENEDVNFSSLVVDGENKLWVGTFGYGLYYKTNTDTSLTLFKGFGKDYELPPNLNILSLLIDSQDRLWIATYGNGVYLIDFRTKSINAFRTQPNNPRALQYDDILSSFEDYTGTVWLGTDGTGLSYFDEHLSKFNTLTNASTPSSIEVDVARAITMDSKGVLWIGTSGKGLTSFNPKTGSFKSFKHDVNTKNSISSDRVMSLYNDQNGLWIGFQDEGLMIYNHGIFRKYNSESQPALTAATIWCIYKDSKSRYWLGTRDDGLIQFDPVSGVLKQYTYDKQNKSSISSNNIRVITQGANNELWIGTENDGINRFNISEESFERQENPLVKNVKSLYFDRNNLWIGTNGKGLIHFDPGTKKYAQYSLKQGLPNNVIYAILPDSDNNLWLSSNRGITRFSMLDSEDTREITNYSDYDGLQALEFNTGASFQDENGYLYFGGLNGLNWFKPSSLSPNPIPPRTVFSKLEVFNEEVDYTKKSIFNYKENTFTFSYAGLHFSQPERNLYKYQLINYDAGWSEPSYENAAHYTNLPSGDYTFTVVSSNYDGAWDESPSQYSFTINPPWYLTLWAKIAYLLIFLALLIAIYKYLKWRWHMQIQLQLEHRETERLKRLDELKTKLYTNISHEFRTPLTLISGPVQQLISSSRINDKDKSSLQIIESSAERMLRLVNQLLNLSQLETGDVTLEVGNHDLKAQIVQILEVFNLSANEKGIKIKADVLVISETWYDRDVLEKILFNLLSNAVKYSPENSVVGFSAIQKGNALEIEVENPNEDLSESDFRKLFTRFFKKDKNSEGVGIGLSLIKGLVMLSNGTIKAFRKDPSNLVFAVSLPVSKNSYQANSISKSTSIPFDFLKNENGDIFVNSSEEKPEILLVEDNDEVRNYLKSIFEEDFVIILAKDGLDGIKKAIKHVPDLIISDIMMPKKNGIELCLTLKEDTRTCHIPIIMLTAKTDKSTELKSLRNKADDFISKPFNADVILQKALNMVSHMAELRKRYSQNVYLRPKDIAVVDMDTEFLEAVQQLIDTRFTETDFTSEDFAAALNMSRMQLHRKLKALTGLSTSEFIRSQRLKTAVKLLVDSDLTVSEIAYSVGFNAPSYFTKCFKELYDCSPTEYVKSNGYK